MVRMAGAIVCSSDWSETLPQACFENIIAAAGPKAACLSCMVCRQWRQWLDDDRLWVDVHQQLYGPHPLKWHTWRSSFRQHALAGVSWARGRPLHSNMWPDCHSRWVAALDLSPQYVLTGSVSAEAKVWDRQTGSWIHYLGGSATHGSAHSGHTSAVTAVRFAGPHKAVTGSRDGTVRTWDMSTGREAGCTQLGDPISRQWVNSIDVYWPQGPPFPPPTSLHPFSTQPHSEPLGRPLHQGHTQYQGPHIAAVGTSIGSLMLLDGRQPAVAASLQHTTAFGSIYSVSVSGHHLAAACATGRVHLFDLRSRSHVLELPGHASAVTALSLQAGGGLVVAGDLQGCLYTWLIPDLLSGCHGSPRGSDSHARDASRAVADVDSQYSSYPGAMRPEMQGGAALVGWAQMDAEWVRSVVVPPKAGVFACTVKDGCVSVYALPPVAAAALGVSEASPGWPLKEPGTSGKHRKRGVEKRVKLASDYASEDSDTELDSTLSRLQLGISYSYHSDETQIKTSGGFSAVSPFGRGAQRPGLRLISRWSVGGNSVGSASSSSPATASSSATGAGQIDTDHKQVQAYALAADEWSLFAGCTDCSVREWQFNGAGMGQH